MFKAKYDGVCGICGFSIEKGDEIHYVNDKVAHEYCHAPDGSGESYLPEDHERHRHQAGYRVYGKREPKICNQCHIEHGVGQKECW